MRHDPMVGMPNSRKVASLFFARDLLAEAPPRKPPGFARHHVTKNPAIAGLCFSLQRRRD